MSKLLPHDFNRFAIGLFDSEMIDGAWRAHRIPAGALRDHYMAIDWGRLRSTCPAGVRLRFQTDAQQITAKFRFGERSRARNGAALVVDDNSSPSPGTPGEGWGEGSVHSNMAPAVQQNPHPNLLPAYRERGQATPAGPIEWAQDIWEGAIFEQPERRLRSFDLWLPHMCQCDVMEIDAGDAEIVPLPRPAVRWLVYGDSITQGMETPLPTDTVIGRCARALDAEVFNLAIGGAQFERVLADTFPDGAFDLVSVAYGANDFHYNMPIETHVQSIQRFIDACRRKLPDTPIVLITAVNDVLPGRKNASGDTLDDFRRGLQVFRNQPRIMVIPGETLVPPEKQYFIDDVHPNGLGFKRYAQNLLPHLSAALARR